MKKQLLNRLRGPGLERCSALLCLAACFAAGAVGGCFFAGALDEDAATSLFDYFGGYFASIESGLTLHFSLLSAVWEVLRWPLLTFVLGFTVLGVVGLPVAFCVRGFLLSYAVSVLVRLYGAAGLVAALAVFGFSDFFVLPALFTLGVDAFRAAGSMAGNLLGDSRRTFSPGQGRLFRTGCCSLLLATAAVLQLQLTPVLLSAAAELLQ